MYRFLCLLFFITYASTSIAAGTDRATELKYLLANAKEDTSKMNLYKEFVTLYNIENPDSALYFIEVAKKLAIKMDDPKSLGIMYDYESKIKSLRGAFDLAKSAELKALENFYHADYKKGVSISYNALGVIEAKTGNFKQATSYFLRALKINEEIKNNQGIIQNYISLGTVNSQLELLNKANIYFFKALKLMPDSVSMTFLNLCNNIGIVYGKMGDYKRSIDYFNRGLKVADKVINGQTTKVSLLLNIAIAYANINETNTAINYYNQAHNLSVKYNLIEEEARVLYNIAILYEDSNPSLAINYYNKVLSIAKQMGHKQLLTEVYQSIYIINKKIKNYKSAIEALEHFHTYQDSVFSLENTSAIELLQSNFELEKTKGEVQVLEMANQKQKSNQIIAFLIVGGSLFSLGLVALNSRKRNILNIELKSSITVRDKLLSIITHDLKSPIHNVISLIKELELNELGEEDRKYLLAVLKKQASMSLDTLENILKWGQAQMRGISANPQEFRISELINKNIELIEVNSKSKNINITYQGDDSLKAFADIDQLDFVLRNFISNAIKFTKINTEIIVNASITNENKLRVSVQDRGEGMDKGTLDTLFGVNQIINIGTANEKGSGLALLLCKEFVEANNGRIWAETELGIGSVFYFTCDTST